jgi:hypothetical protein
VIGCGDSIRVPAKPKQCEQLHYNPPHPPGSGADTEFSAGIECSCFAQSPRNIGVLCFAFDWHILCSAPGTRVLFSASNISHGQRRSFWCSANHGRFSQSSIPSRNAACKQVHRPCCRDFSCTSAC